MAEWHAPWRTRTRVCLLRILPRDAREAACAVGAREVTERKSILLSFVKVSKRHTAQTARKRQQPRKWSPKYSLSLGLERFGRISTNQFPTPEIRQPGFRLSLSQISFSSVICGNNLCIYSVKHGFGIGIHEGLGD